MTIRIKAIDVSEWNPLDPVRIATLRDIGIEAVACRASNGYRVDPSFRGNWTLLKQHRFLRMAYHNLQPQLDLNTQLNTFIGQLNGDYGELGEWVDTELTGGVTPRSRVLNISHDFMHRYTTRTSRTIGPYSARWFWNELTTWINEHPQWAAQWPYDNQPNIKEIIYHIFDLAAEGQLNPTALPPGWTNVIWWQISAKGFHPAVLSHDVDFNVSIPTREEVLQLYEIPSPPTRPETLEELIDRFIELENWAIAQGYIRS